MVKQIAIVLVVAAAACNAFSSGSGDGAGTPEDAGVATAEAGSGGDAASSGGDAGADSAVRGRVACKTAQGSSCAAGPEVCCLQWNSNFDLCIPAPAPISLAMSCPPGSSDAGDTRIVACDDSRQCAAGEVCCADMTTQSRINSACIPAANCNQPSYKELCNTRGLSCRDGGSCIQLGAYDNYSYCQ